MRRTSRSSKSTRKIPENLSDLAAWLYTDLLLGLAVAFVGAGTFLVYDKTTRPGKGTPVILTYQLSCDEVTLTVPRSISSSSLNGQVISAIDNAAIARNWQEPKAGLLLINGGSGGGDVSVGSAIAERFSREKVDKASKLQKVKRVTGGDKSLSTSQIRLKIFVVYKGDETENGCS